MPLVEFGKIGFFVGCEAYITRPLNALARKCQSDAGADQEAAGDPVSKLADLAKPAACRAGKRNPQGIADADRDQENST